MEKSKLNKSKRAQVTIFIILALIIVVMIAMVFMIWKKPTIEVAPETDPQKYIEKCTRDAVSESVEKVLVGGGRIEPEFYIMYQGNKYNYLCYNKNYYVSCINQYPRLKNIAEAEIKNDSIGKILECFSDLKNQLEERSFSVSENSLDLKIEVSLQKVLIKMDKKFDISKGEDLESFKKFNSQVISPLYELIMIARQIVNQESQYCNFEYNGFMLFYPQYDIKRISYDEGRLYTITDRTTEKQFRFAVRSCAFPPGV